MTTSTTPPLLTPLPPAPLPTDAEALFDAKAGASLTAQAVMVGEVNTALNWQADSMAATAGSMTAAASSATAAAASATAAAGSVVSAQAQVGLAAVQAGNAAASANSAQVAAAAAGSAVGLPSMVGNAGKAMVVRLDESGFELKAVSQSIGDALETARIPDPTYLLPNTVYSRAAYPDLFSIVGTQGEKNDGANFAARLSGQLTSNIYRAVACGKDNVFIAVGNLAAGLGSTTGSTAIKSTDGGVTWTPIAALNNLYGLYNVATDEKGVWVISSYSTVVHRSSDNGITWSTIGTGLGGPAPSIATNKNGVWLLSQADNSANSVSRSLDNGITWSVIPAPSAIGVVSADNKGGFYILGSSSLLLYKSINNGSTWYVVTYNPNTSIAGVMSGANVTVFWSEYKFFISSDGGVSWTIFPCADGQAANKFCVDREGVIYIQMYGSMCKSYDYGMTWDVTAFSSFPFNAYSYLTGVAMDGNGNWVVLSANPSVYAFQVSARLYNYDILTQFKTPSHSSPKGYKSYIKGKLQ